MRSHHTRNDDYRDSTRHSNSRGSIRNTRDTTDDRRSKELKNQSRPIKEEPMDVDMDDDSDGNDRHGSHRDPYPRAIIPLNPERDQPRVRPDSDRDFWIPNEGIEREVITYEITRYLGQDALVRPSKNDKGRNGYLITAFCAPTTTMIRSMKEASGQYLREKNSRSRPAAYSSSRTANDRDQENIRDRDPDQPRRRGRDYDSDDSMDDAPPPARGYDRYEDRRDPGPRRDGHDREREIDPRQVPDTRYQDPRLQDLRLQDPRLQDFRPQDPRYQDPRLQDPRIQDPRYQDSRYQSAQMMVDSRTGRQVMLPVPVPAGTYTEPRNRLRKIEQASQHMDPQKAMNPFIRPGMLQDLPILFGRTTQKMFMSVPDTGATLNILNYRFLMDMSSDEMANMLVKQSTETEYLEMANGNVISTMGQVTLSCAFLDKPHSVMEIPFHLCKLLADNVQVVFGKQFLEATKTLTSFSHRLRERRLVFRFPRVMSMATTRSPMRSHMQIFMNSTPSLAYPDTGSEIDLVSMDYVRRRAYNLLSLKHDDLQRMCFADGIPQELLGKIIVQISMPKLARPDKNQPLSSNSQTTDFEGYDMFIDEDSDLDQSDIETSDPRPKLSQERVFYILDRLNRDVIVGQSFLYSVDAFKSQKHTFQDSDPTDFRNTLNGMYILRNVCSTWCASWFVSTSQDVLPLPPLILFLFFMLR